MSYTAPVQGQLFTLAVFLGVGFLLGLLFELLRFLRRLFAGEGVAAVRVQDVLFCTLSFFVLFFSLLAFSNGKLRVHLLLTAAAGFMAFRLSVGGLLRRLLDRCCKTARNWGAAVLRPFRSLAAHVQKAFAAAKNRLIRRKDQKRADAAAGAGKKLRKKRKRDLKKQEKSV